MKKKNPPRDKESLPVSSARLMAFLVALMSLGMLVIIYFFFIKVIFSGTAAWLVLAVMLIISFFSDKTALQSVRKRITCTECGQPFFSQARQMFLPAKQCAFCKQPPPVSVIER